MLVCFLDMLDEALAPTGGAFGANAPQTGGWIFRIRYGARKLLGRFHPRNEKSIRADIQRALDEANIAFRESDESNRITADRRAQVRCYFLPIEMPMLGIDDDPVQATGDRDFGHAGAFQRDPQTEYGLV